MAMEGCKCGDEEAVEETETVDQSIEQVGEAGSCVGQEFASMDKEIASDNQAASQSGGATNEDDEEEEGDEEEDLEESYANSNDDGFQSDIDFMTKVISGGLNKQKSTGQTTIPVIAGQDDRMGYSVKESVSDWKKLAGI
jgi:hypothetical protein